MSIRFHLRCSTRFYASPQQIWARKTQLESLNDEFAPFLRMSVSDRDGLAAALKGRGIPARFDARLWLLGVIPGPTWPIEMVSWDDGKQYVDRSENALFHEWEHRHFIEQASDACRYVDAVTFIPRAAPQLTARLIERLFEHRHHRAAAGLDSDARATGIAMLREADMELDDGTSGFL